MQEKNAISFREYFIIHTDTLMKKWVSNYVQFPVNFIEKHCYKTILCLNTHSNVRKGQDIIRQTPIDSYYTFLEPIVT